MRAAWLLFLATAVCAQDELLARAVDLPTAAERKAAAVELAQREDVSLARWLEVMRDFGPTRPIDPGARTTVVPLRLEGKTEQTEITVFVPGHYEPQTPAPLLLALHGAGGDGRHEYRRWVETAEALGMIVVAPSDAKEEAGYAFTPRERALNLAVVRWARRRFRIDENRVHVTGISAGGHGTWDLGLRYPDRFASLAPMIGGPRLDTRGGQNNLRFIENAVPLAIRDLQGLEDDKRLIFNLRFAFKQLKRLGAEDASFLAFDDMGHAFRFDAVDWKDFYARVRRKPRPRRVVHTCADRRLGAAHWVDITAVSREVREAFTPKVVAREWNALGDEGRRHHVLKAAAQRTARLEVTMAAPGVFEATSHGVKRFRLLLTPDMIHGQERVHVRWNGRVRKKKARPSKRVLLEHFVERFDTGFLPIAEVSVR